MTMTILQYPIYSKSSCTINCFSPHSTMQSANEQSVPSESYLQEVWEQLEERWEESEENQHHRETRSASDHDNTGKVCISAFSQNATFMHETLTPSEMFILVLEKASHLTAFLA